MIESIGNIDLPIVLTVGILRGGDILPIDPRYIHIREVELLVQLSYNFCGKAHVISESLEQRINKLYLYI